MLEISLGVTLYFKYIMLFGIQQEYFWLRSHLGFLLFVLSGRHLSFDFFVRAHDGKQFWNAVFSWDYDWLPYPLISGRGRVRCLENYPHLADHTTERAQKR